MPKSTLKADELREHPYHIRLQQEEPKDIEAQIDEGLSSWPTELRDYAGQNPKLRSNLGYKCLLTNAIEKLRSRLAHNPNNSPELIQWGNDLLDVIKAINNG